MTGSRGGDRRYGWYLSPRRLGERDGRYEPPREAAGGVPRSIGLLSRRSRLNGDLDRLLQHVRIKSQDQAGTNLPIVTPVVASIKVSIPFTPITFTIYIAVPSPFTIQVSIPFTVPVAPRWRSRSLEPVATTW